jgi:hypothetical protein
MDAESGMMNHFLFFRILMVFALETKMAMSSSASFISSAICSALIMPESISNSNHQTVSSSSGKPPSIVLTSSASERLRLASRTCAPTHVPERKPFYRSPALLLMWETPHKAE